MVQPHHPPQAHVGECILPPHPHAVSAAASPRERVVAPTPPSEHTQNNRGRGVGTGVGSGSSPTGSTGASCATAPTSRATLCAQLAPAPVTAASESSWPLPLQEPSLALTPSVPIFPLNCVETGEFMTNAVPESFSSGLGLDIYISELFCPIQDGYSP